ncbi:monocarboxylate transporter 14 [Aplysia californica]|uniref:Monocarboxylate transporter 14 n=1 Tax=Aplysia californica TaxID=6500 RepID=A0ABM0K4A7_APLCA|nr:monocarboxylate transporter 14 [Aplysia californica]
MTGYAGGMTSVSNYCWVMVACSFAVHMITSGTMFSLGVLYVSWLQDFGQSKGLTSWVVSIGVAFLFGIGPLPSALIAKFGNRVVQMTGSLMASLGFALGYFVTSVPQLILTVGVVVGIGLGFNYLPAVTMIAEYFNKRRSMAYGIATAGVGIGSFLQAPLINWLEEQYGWRGAMLILSGFPLHLSILALLMKPRADFAQYELDVGEKVEKDGESTDVKDSSVLVERVTVGEVDRGSKDAPLMKDVGGEVKTDSASSQSPDNQPQGNVLVRGLHHLLDHFSLLKDKIFFSLALSNIFTNLSFLMPVFYMVDRAVEAGIDKSSAALLVSVNGIGNVVGRILFGLLGDLPCVDSVVLYVLTLTVCGAGTCVSPVCGGSLVLQGVYSAFFGIFMGGYVTLGPVVTAELMGVARLTQAFSLLLFFMGVAGALGPPLAGWVYEWTGGFTAAFILHGAWIILSAAVLLPAVVSRHWRKRREL